MKTILQLIFVLLFFQERLFAQGNQSIPGQCIVMLHSTEDTITLVKNLNTFHGIATKLHVAQCLSEAMHIYLFEFNAQSINENTMLYLLQNHPLVKIAQFNHLVEKRYTPNDDEFSQQWNMSNNGQNGGIPGADIDAPNAWDIATGGLTSAGDSIVVAVIDGGFDMSHQDLNFWKNYGELPNNGIDDDGNGFIDDVTGWNFGNNSNSHSVMAHGTHISGIIGAKGNNTWGVTGINWGIKVMALSIDENSNDLAYESNIVAAYSYIMEQRRTYNQSNGAEGAFVVSTNSSFGVNLAQAATFPLWCAMYDSLGSVGILNAAATANANIDVDVKGDMPSSCASNWMISVTSTDKTDAKAIAGYGATAIDLGAPGDNITSTSISNNYVNLTGTSMATPHVAGAIALMYAVDCSQLIIDYKNDPAGFALMIKDSLLGATDPIPALNAITVSGGRLNLYKSVKAIQNHYFNEVCPSGIISVEENDPTSPFLIINTLYPNPAKKMVRVNFSNNTNEKIYLNLHNPMGELIKKELIYEEPTINQDITIDLNSLSRGIYFIQLNSSSQSSNLKKLIVY